MSVPTFHAFEATVVAVEDLSPAFRRVVLGGPGMQDFGLDTHPLDLRIKLVIPPGGGDPVFDLATFLDEESARGGSWYQSWLQVDPAVRGDMRTYTVRQWRDDQRELVVDMVLHTDADGHSGPASQWAQNAQVGRRIHVIGRRRTPDGEPMAPAGGVEFAPGDADHLLLVGDETAVPAIASILDFLRDRDVRGQALLEVPTAQDVLDIDGPPGIEVRWLPREGADPGSCLVSAVREVMTTRPPEGARGGSGADVELEDVDVDAQILWDVPAALGEAARGSGTETAAQERPFYAWIAGEAAAVKQMRRFLVREVGVDRRQVAFMGYWRQGRSEGQ